MAAELNVPIVKTANFQESKIVIATGLALFAMFFGAGNIVFPLHLGANSGQNLIPATLGFLLAGVGVPFLGLLATSLYQGDYTAFFARLGKWPAFITITFLMIIIGPLVAIPRTEAATFNALLPYLPKPLNHNATFSMLYCVIVFLLACRETKVVTILGLVLSPIKIISFTSLVIMGLLFSEAPHHNALTSLEAFRQSMSCGYNTMDLLAAFFYCTVAFKSIDIARMKNPSLNTTHVTLKSCIFGALITGTVYLGFMLVAFYHADSLQGLPEEQMISAVSHAVLGKFGGFFVCIAVSFACVATALALAEVTSEYLHRTVFKERISKIVCLLMVMVTTYCMTNLGFQGIMQLAGPILNIVYPALIVFCIMNILYKWKGIKMVKFPVVCTLLISAFLF